MNLTKAKVILVIVAAVAAELFVPAFGYSAQAGTASSAGVTISR